RRPRQLQGRAREPHLLRRAAQHADLHHRGGRDEGPARHLAGLSAVPAVRRPQGRPGVHRHPVHVAHHHQRPRLEVDARLAVQRLQLGPQPPRPHRCLRQRGMAGMARAARAGPRLGHVRQRVARIPVQRHRAHGRDDVGVTGDHRGGAGGWRQLPPAVPEGHRADDRPDPLRGHRLRHRLHAVRSLHRLHPHQRRPRRRHRGAPHPGLQHGYQGRGARARCRRRALLLPAPAARHGPPPAHAASEAVLMATVALQVGRPPRSARAKEIRRTALIYLGLTPYFIIAVFPIFWMAITALKQEPDLYRMDVVPFWFHLPPTLKNFSFLFTHTSYGYWIVNTVLISFWVSGLTLLTAVPAGYALARLRLPFAENLGIGIFMTYLVPGIILFIPLARVVSSLNLWDSWWSLVVVYPTFTIPFCTWLLMGFFKTVPFEIEEAAMLDGCGQFGALLRVVLPVSVPGLITAVIFSFTLSMQDFLYSLA